MATDLYGQRIGTVQGIPFFANRVLPPSHYRTATNLSESLHFRFLLTTNKGVFYSPHCTVEAKGDRWVISSRPLLLEQSFVIQDVAIYDFENQLKARPLDLAVPRYCDAGQLEIYSYEVAKVS